MINFNSPAGRASAFIVIVATIQAVTAAGLSYGWSKGSIVGTGVVLSVAEVALICNSMLSLEGMIKELAGHLVRMSRLDLTGKIRIGGWGPSVEALRALDHLQTTLRSTVGTIRSGAEEVSTASAEIATGNQDLSHRTEQTSGNLQRTASSLAQLTGDVRKSADSAAQANQLAGSATQVALRGGEVVSQVVVTMDEINASSKKIAEITGVIDGIAFQTNILALNAAVEAARAGEQGRGFAVVASEVRTLAQRSAEAAKAIKSLIGMSVEKVETGTRLVSDAGATMTEIVASVQRVTDIIGAISSSAVEQSHGIDSVNGAVAGLDHATQQNAALVEQSAAAAESLKEQAQRMTGVVAGFHID